ncbi:glycosyltransferase [Maribacter sp. X9]|uniref:glycosyltransferase n=1 Tax=Maribacter sp. X9 TaxID=3402159 RepID=UPI003AF3EAA2
MKTIKTKIFFFIPSLRAGGAERVVSFIAQNIDKAKFEPTLYVIGTKEDATFEVTDVAVEFLNHRRVSKSFGAIFNTVRKGKPDIVFGTIGHVNILLGFIKLFFPKTIFIGREVNVISVLSEVQEMKGKLPKWLGLYLVNRLDVMVCQSVDMAVDVKKMFGIPDRKVKIINNPVSKRFQLKNHEEDSNSLFKLITIGSLSSRKGHLRLLEVLKDVTIPFSYTIVGNGDLKDEIFETIRKYNLEDKVTHIPFSDEVAQLLQNHDLFLLGSFVEGFPNVLLESCAVGTPVISFNILGGINEIIIEGVNGYIANTPEEYVEKIVLASKQDWNRKEIRNTVVSRYNEDKIISDYEQLFLSEVNK